MYIVKYIFWRWKEKTKVKLKLSLPDLFVFLNYLSVIYFLSRHLAYLNRKRWLAKLKTSIDCCLRMLCLKLFNFLQWPHLQLYVQVRACFDLADNLFVWPSFYEFPPATVVYPSSTGHIKNIIKHVESIILAVVNLNKPDKSKCHRVLGALAQRFQKSARSWNHETSNNLVLPSTLSCYLVVKQRLSHASPAPSNVHLLHGLYHDSSRTLASLFAYSSMTLCGLSHDSLLPSTWLFTDSHMTLHGFHMILRRLPHDSSPTSTWLFAWFPHDSSRTSHMALSHDSSQTRNWLFMHTFRTFSRLRHDLFLTPNWQLSDFHTTSSLTDTWHFMDSHISPFSDSLRLRTYILHIISLGT